MNGRRALWIAIAATALAGAVGCSDSTTPADGNNLCSRDEECPIGQYCDDGLCTPATITCQNPSDCPEGMVCRHGACVAAGNDGGTDGDGGADGADGGDQGGPEPDIEIVEPAGTGDPPVYQIDFGNVQVGVTASQQVKVRNRGQAELRLLELNLEAGGNTTEFSVASETQGRLPIALSPGQETQLDVLYRAQDGLSDTGILDIISNDPDQPLVKIHLLSEFKGVAQISVQPVTLAFGDVPVGASSAPLAFTAANTGSGNAVLSVSSIALENPADQDFSLAVEDSGGGALSAPFFLNHNDFATVRVTYHPQRAESDSEGVIVASNDALNPSARVALSGTGVVAGVEVQPSPIDLGRVRVGQHGEREAVIRNSGGADLLLSGVSLSAGGPEWSLSSPDVDLATLPASPKRLLPGESIRVVVGCDPLALGAKTATLTIENQNGQPARDVSAQALAYVPPHVETIPDPAQFDFGAVQLDAATSQADQRSALLRIRNTGNDPLHITRVARATGTSAEFDFSPASFGAAIGPGEEAQLTVSFRPAATGQKNGVILVDTDDPDIELDSVVGRFAVVLAGRGVDPALSVEPASIAFGDVTIGGTATRTITIRDLSADPLTVTGIRFGSGSSSDFALENLPANFPVVLSGPAVPLTITVRYSPPAAGDDIGSVEVLSDDLGMPLATVSLSGRGAGCPSGFGDCDGNIPGCETPLNTNQNCGGCGVPCAPANANGDCSTGTCQVASCIGLWADCNGQPGDGCETPTNTNQNCGGCSVACAPANATGDCSTGTCQVASCIGLWGNCNGQPGDGCETPTNTTTNCGGCGVQCAPAHATGTCSTGTCQVASCNFQYCNANGSVGDGCEFNLDTNPSCGSYTDIGAVQGDQGADILHNYGTGEKWLRLWVAEANSDLSCVYLSAVLRLYPPANTDYDLYVYCDNCTTQAGSSSNGGSTMEEVQIAWDEDYTINWPTCVPSGSESGRYVYINIRYYSANICDQWHLAVYGNVEVSSRTCSRK
ncbi:MAG: choice-of-anchor D domain-containing protein [Myxococcales bacterium]|nr:choice-of-anchor D domain-containing protein [Myxococcales bacterium]